MDHTEKVLEEMLESLFDENSNDKSREEENFNQIPSIDGNNDSPTNSFVEDVNQFFNINQSRCNDKNRMREVKNQITFENTEQEKDGETSTCTPKNVQNLTIAEELKKMRLEFPINSEEFDKKMNIESCNNLPEKTYSPKNDYYKNKEEAEDVNQQMSSTDFSKSADNNAFLDEVKRVLYGKTNENFPEYNSTDYFNVAQEYAVFGNDFLDFPQDLDAIINQVKTNKKPIIQFEMTPSNSEVVPSAISITEPPKSTISSETKLYHSEINASGRNSRANYSEQTAMEPLNLSGNSTHILRRGIPDRPSTTNKQLSVAATAGAATAATYYQLCTNIQPALRPITAVNSAAATAVAVNASNPAYNMLLHNNVSYLANGTHNVPPQQVFYNQRQLSTTTKCYANQTAIGNAANVRFPNPVDATKQISNTVFKETQYVANMPVPNSTGISNGNVCERMVHSQMLQQNIFQARQQQQQQQHRHRRQHQQNQQQQQAMVAAAMYQQQLQRQQQQQHQQIRIATSLQSTAINVAGTINSNTSGYTASVPSSNTMLSTQPVNTNSFGNCTHSSSVYGGTIPGRSYDSNNVDTNSNQTDNHGMN